MIKLSGSLKQDGVLSGHIDTSRQLSGKMKLSVGGAKTYGELPDKPKLNSVEIVGDKVSADYGLQDKMEAMTPQDIDKIIFGGSFK